MALTASQEQRLRSALHRSYSAASLPIPVTKADADAAVAAADGWVDSSAASFNAALPAVYRGAASAEDKAVLLLAVVAAQRLVGNPDLLGVLRQLIGEMMNISEA